MPAARISSSVATSSLARSGGEPKAGLELGPHRTRGRNADLLADNRSQKRRCSGRAAAGLRAAVPFQNLRERGFEPGELIETFLKRVGRSNHQATLAA